MDYDDNDFQCQSFQIAGENSNKFPPSLRSLPLLKFDLDEHLQVHPRFDSLVEAEVLLGIQDQGHNWIEDFTPVGSEIDFSSTGAESCSISRPKNVWSEATSSESVEMLLKSVGGDEMIDQKVLTEEADADVGLNGMDSQTDTCLRQDVSYSKTVDIIHIDPVLPPDKCLKHLSLLCEDANKYELKVESSLETSQTEKSGTDIDISTLSEKFNTRIVDGQCSMDKESTLSPNHAIKSPLIDEAICGAVRNDDHSHNPYTKLATDDPNVSVLTGDSSDFVNLRSTKDNLYSVSASNIGLIPGKITTQMLSGQVVEEHSVIEISEKSSSLADGAQKESSQISGTKVNDQPSRGLAMRSGLSIAEGSTFLDTTMEPLMLLDETCSGLEFPGNPSGGLVSAVNKALNQESQAVKIALPATESYSLVMEGDGNVGKTSVGAISKMSCLTKEYKNAGYSEHVDLSKDDATNERPLSVENVNMDDNYDGTELNSSREVIQEKQNPDFQLTDDNYGNKRNTSKFTEEANSLNDMCYEMTSKAIKNDDVLGFNTLTFQSPNCTGIVKSVDVDVTENIVKEPEVKLNAPRDGRSEESLSSALLDDTHKPSSLSHRKLFHKCDTIELVAEPHNFSVFPQEVASLVQEKTALASSPHSVNSEDDASIVMEKEDASSGCQKTSISTTSTDWDESVVGHAAVVNLHSLNNYTDVHQSQPEGALPMDAVVELKEPSTTRLPASVLIQPDEKELDISESIILESNEDGQIAKVSDDSVVMDCSSAKDMTNDEQGIALAAVDISLHSLSSSIDVHKSQTEDTLPMDVVVEQKEETPTQFPASVFIESGEKEVEFLEAKETTQDKPGFALATVDVNLHSLSSSTDFCQSQSEDTLPTDVVGVQKEVTTTRFSTSFIIQPYENKVEVSGSTILKSNIVSQISRESDGPVVVDSSSAKDMTQDDPEVSDVGCQNELQSSIGTHEHEHEHEHELQLEGNLVAPASSVKGNVNCDSSGAFCREEKTSLIMSGPGDNYRGQNDIAQAEDGAASPCTSHSLDSEILTIGNAESNIFKSESGNPNISEQDCGSPTVIGCSGHSKEGMGQEGNRQPPDPTDSISIDLPSVTSETRATSVEVKYCSHDSKETKTPDGDRSFTFEVRALADLPERDSGNKWKPNIQSCEPPQISEENSEESHLESKMECHRTITKNPEDDNTRQVSGFSTTNTIAVSQAEVGKETPIPKKSAGSDGNPCSAPKSVGTVNKNVQFEEMQQYSYSESNIKESLSPILDLNTSISAAALFHQPFTDPQQVQLRAQIFVYGSLIQGIPPDEACMISAFGEAAGGRSLWEGTWRVSVERYQIQKSPFSSYETPTHSQSVISVSEQASRCSSFQSKAPSILSRSGSKAVTTNSTLPFPSPLWSVSSHDGLHSNMPRVPQLDFNQALSPLYPHQSSQIRQYTGNSTPWLSQSLRPGPWAGSSQNSTLGAVTQYSAIPVAEIVQATPARDSSVPHALTMQVVSPTAFLGTPEPTSVSATTVVQIESQRKTATPGNTKSTLTGQKSRKRKKGTSVHEELQPNILVSEPLANPASATVTSHIISPTHYQIISHSGTEQRAIFSEETCSKIEQAKLQAEDAAAFAASAVRHCQGVWSQLATHKNSGLVSEVTEKLASAAVAVAAAANVAKAAAAAANVASDAALQAKLMADDALKSVRTGNLARISETDHLDVGKSLAKLTPVSVVKGKDKINDSSSIISAAREAARRRVEAASAATKRAENLDAIVRAAELAAEAVSQAGTVIAMGDPLPFTLSELVEAGSEGYWKIYHSTTGKLAKVSSLYEEKNIGEDGGNTCGISFEELNDQPSNNKRTHNTTNEDGRGSSKEHPVQSEEHYEGNASAFPNNGHEKDNSASNNKENSIQKGCLVEVVGDEDRLRGVWFSACVLDVKDEKAYICYNNLVSDEGTGPLKEWILLEDDRDKAPRIRLAHPITAAKYEGTRKRRREAMGNYEWAVGDHVDAWIRDGWREGIVTEKSRVDDTKLAVHFPGGGDSSDIRAWNLRPSLVWKEGHWIEWSRTKENAVQPEGDTPQEKRQKLGRPEASIDSEIDGKGISKLSKNLPVDGSRKPEESRPLILSAKDKTFSVGKNGREENNYDTLNIRRRGLQKEGSRVVFGVPKPGKKRKFMEVSKHYIEDKTDKTSEGKDSAKFAKYLMPQASRIWRNTSKVDAKGKFLSDSKPKELKSVKSRSIQRDNSSITTLNGGDSGHGSLLIARSALSIEQNNLVKKSRLEVGSDANPGAMENPHVEPSVQSVPVFPASKKKSAPTVETNSGVNGKLTLPVNTSSISGDGSENTGKTISDATEPRRSNRRIQPTSRLLEGLQSSLIISKIPSFPHDKGTKTHQRSASSRGNAHG